MKSPSDPGPGSVDLKPAEPAADRRMAPRRKASTGAKLLLGPGDIVACKVLDISDTGAVLEVPGPIERETLDVAFDGDAWPHRSCRVVWANGSRMGVQFLTMGALLDGYEAARQRHNAVLAERRRKDEVIDRELQEVIGLLNQSSKFLEEKKVTFDIANRTLRIAHQRAPVLAIRYDPEIQKYDTTFMPDGSHTSAKDSQECVKAVGEMIYGLLTR